MFINKLVDFVHGKAFAVQGHFNFLIATEAINQLGLEKDENQEKEQLQLQGAKIMRRYQRLPLSQRNQKDHF